MSRPESSFPLSWWYAAGLLALGYFIAGRLGLLLAIPPGYATAVWPASGIALAGLLMARDRAVVGVWLGSLAVNVSTSLDATDLQSVIKSLWVPVIIAGGAALQAWVGKRLILRSVGLPSVMEDSARTLRMLLIGGPVSCIISASVGIFCLVAQGLIPLQNIAFNWWTWWVGDSIGVLVVTPLLLIWLQGPLRQRRRRKAQISLVMATLFFIVVSLFIYSSRQEVQRLEDDFARITDDAATRFQRDLRDDWQALYSVAGFMEESEHRNWPAFERFASGQLRRIVGVKSLSWVPWVTHEERENFERGIRAQGFPEFQIRERSPSGKIIPAAERARYAPVTFIVPRAGNEAVLGFNNDSESIRAETLARASRTGLPAASAAITLVQDGVLHRGMLLMVAMRPDESGDRGYAVAAIRNDALIEASLGSNVEKGMQIRVFEDQPEPGLLIYGPAAPDAPGGMTRTLPLDVGGLVWRIQFHWSADYLLAHRTWHAWMVLAAGMLFAGLFGMFLLVLIGRGEQVQKLVEARTAELALEVERGAQLERETRRHAEDLEASNRELEQFAYAVSHDLQAPLRGISSFARLLEKRSEKMLDERSKEFVGFIQESAADMGRLIEDLLALSKVNAQRAEMGVVSAEQALDKACDLLRADLDACQAVIERAEWPQVRGDARLLTQLFQNLLGNAIKFRRPEVAPRVILEVLGVPDGWRFAVRDNGIGIAAENIPRLFQIFKRLHTQDQYPGSGIGLALCRKIVALHGGRIWMESELGAGTTVFFTLMAAQESSSGSDIRSIKR